MKRIKPIALLGMIGATMVAPTIADASTSGAVYNSTPVEGTVSVPSLGPEAYSFNQIGNEVILRPHTAAIRHVRVTMVSWSCQSGTGSRGCTTTPGTTFKTPVTLNLYRSSTINSATGEVNPGSKIMSVTKTFAIHYRPSSASATEPRFWAKTAAPQRPRPDDRVPDEPEARQRRRVDRQLQHGEPRPLAAGGRVADGFLQRGPRAQCPRRT